MLTEQELEYLKKKYAGLMALSPEDRALATELYIEMLGDPSAETIQRLADFDAKRKARRVEQ